MTQEAETVARIVAWQPIETCPKDGSSFLAGRFVENCNHGRNGLIERDFWHNAKKHGYSGLGCFNGTFWPATHWMPLPDPPALEPVGST